LIPIDEDFIIQLSKEMEVLFNRLGRKATTIELTAAFLLTLSNHITSDPAWKELMKE